jgi:predicted nucleotidyltransferase
MHPRITIHRERLAAFCQQHGIRELSLFGSVLRDDFTQNSDVDVLVEFLPDRAPSFLALGAMEEELTEILGRRVDLVSKRGLRGRIRDRVLAQREVEYVTAGRQDAPG